MKWAIPEKIQTGGVLRIYFFEPSPLHPPPPPPHTHTLPNTPPPLTLPLEIPGKAKLNPRIFCKIVLARYLLEIPKLNRKTSVWGKSHIYMIFLLLLLAGHPSQLFKSFEFGNGSRISDENLVILEFKYLQNKKW